MRLYELYKLRWPVLVEALQNARKTGRFGHAFLIHADRAKVRQDFVKVLFQIGGCPHPDASCAPCGGCSFCTHIENGTWPELSTLTPVGKMYQIQVGDRENPEPNTVRSFTARFSLTSIAEAARKVGVIFDADRMGVEAQNALLKTLEEPPRESLIVLATGNPGALLPTTRSRCQTLQLLENKADFDFSGYPELLKLLEKLVGGGGSLGTAEECAAGIIELAGALKEDAEGRMAAEYETRLANAAEFDERLVKRLSKQKDNAASGAYMGERCAFLAAIYDFFARRYILASGGEAEPAAPAVPVTPETALQELSAAGDLLSALRFNVNESLALRTFVMKIAVKDGEENPQ